MFVMVIGALILMFISQYHLCHYLYSAALIYMLSSLSVSCNQMNAITSQW